MKGLKDLKNLENVKVLMRVDFNVPIQNGVVLDDFRIRKSLPTIKYLVDKGAKVIIISHIEGQDNSLKAVCAHLSKIGLDCRFEKNYRKALEGNDNLILLENLRIHEGEKANDRNFAKELASLADIYVNEAFSVSHREHASVSAITEFIPSYMGFQFEEEIKHLSSAFTPDHPFLFILGGAKFETKLPLIDKFIPIADKIFIGGALANDFFLEQGKDVGASLISEEKIDLKKYLGNEKIILPIDSIKSGTAIMDAGMKTIELLDREIKKAKYILWNGPLGAYETGYKASTLQLAELIAHATKNGVKTIVGGGDTLATITELKLEDSFSFVSTGGGAMLDYLATGTLPGIEALEKSN